MGHGGARKNAGKKKGTKASHTLQAEQAKAELIKAYIENIKPINQALIDEAKKGNIQAIKELHDRVYGKVALPITGAEGGPIKFENITGMKIVKE